MTGNQTEDQVQQLFSSAFFASLVSAVTDASGKPWLLAALPDAAPAPDESESVCVNLILDGSLPGEFLLVIRRAEAALLASMCMRQSPAEFSAEHSQALLQAIEAATGTFCSTLAPQYGAFSISAAMASQAPDGPGNMLENTIADGEGNRVSIRIYFASALTEALSANAAPDDSIIATAAAAKVESLREQVNLDLVMDVELNVTLRFGQRKLTLREVLELTSGSVIELDRQVEEPVELLLEGKVIARGDAVVIDGNYGLRVTEVPKPISSSADLG